MARSRLNAGDRSLVRWLVDRLHVDTTNVNLVKQFARRIKKNYPEGMPRRLRHAIYNYAIRRHEDNRRMYSKVMYG